MTSAPLVVLSPRHTSTLIVSLANRTLPSQKRALTPPECRLRAALKPGDWSTQGGLPGRVGAVLPLIGYPETQ